MKKVEAIIRPHLLDAVRTALQEVDVPLASKTLHLCRDLKG
jgi:nitrogen regulatory protein PII